LDRLTATPAQPAAAWTHFVVATAAAREARNDALLAFAAGEQAYVLFDLGHPPAPWTKSGPSTTTPATPSPDSSAAGSTPPKPR
jgi:hypothetical protein